MVIVVAADATRKKIEKREKEYYVMLMCEMKCMAAHQTKGLTFNLV